MADLENLRIRINEIDDKLIQLLNARMDIVKEIGQWKQNQNMAIYRPEREQEIINRLHKKSGGLLNKAAIEAIFLEIFAVSRNLELPERIGYLGPEGSFTHQAAESRFGALSEYLSLNSIQSVFEAVQTERIRFGVVPIENNQEGVVNETIDQLGKYDLTIAAEIPLAIHFSFATQNDNLKEIKKVFSKDIAFRQCRKFINDTFNGQKLELIPIESTSKAVQLALAEPQSAAICSHIAAKQYQLPILFDNIEDSTDNFTRFLTLSKGFKNNPSGNDKTTILAKLPNKPGSLVGFLQDFHIAGINLTKIESRPAKKGKSFNYWFFIDLDGHIESEAVSSVFDKHRSHIKWLGSYMKMV